MGDSIDWVTATGPSLGKAEVYLDGALAGTFDLYSTKQTWQVHYTFTPSGGGPHTIEVKPLGTKNSRSRGTTVVLDAFSGPITPLPGGHAQAGTAGADNLLGFLLLPLSLLAAWFVRRLT
jgi:hypothetical protein